ncbi:DUF6262 family protein [Staphylococcus xylosus]|uniref:DUF6262 family protein n=2 Tax=Staphylococcus xylosus TaxID=1288 RepID=UPI00049A4D53|nr:DUF6262 family protein [Staphylococcus xylosus]AID42327.1 Tn554-related, transposase C [Staphylococcus xylosus]
MNDFDRQAQLKQLHSKRKAETVEKVNIALENLIKENKEINFNIVSKQSNVSKATLYKNEKIRKKIEELRKNNQKIFTKDKKDNRKDAIIASLKRKIHSLENEKKKLKDEMNMLYNKMYEDI